nr:hypothetical protein [Tanacetum cinerariifolium]
SDGFEQIVDFQNANPIKYALTLQALIDGEKVVVNEASIRHDLKLDDAEGTSCLSNAVIFEELARMGYEKPSKKLTFYKAFFLPQWKFLIHTILQCLSAKTTSWNEFNSTMASAIICLANNQKFNFLKYILTSVMKNLEAGVPFYMFSKFIQVFVNHQLGDLSHHKGIFVTKNVFANIKRVGPGFFDAVTPLFGTMLVQALEEVGDLPTDVQDTPIPDEPSSFQPQRKHKPRRNDPLPSGEDRMQLKELMKLCTNLSNKVLDLENEGRKITNIDADAEVNLENVYKLDMAHEETVLSMQDVDVQSERTKDVVKDVEDVVATAENVEGINAATIPQISKDDAKDKGKGLMVEPKMPLTRKYQIALDKEVARRLKAKWNADMKDNVDWNEVIEQVQSRQLDAVRKYQALKRKLVLVSQARKNMMIYLKNMAGYKMDYFKDMIYKHIRPIFEMEYNKVQAYLNKGPEMDVKRIKALKKRTRKEKVEKDQPAKSKKVMNLNRICNETKAEKQEEAKELKKNLEIVLDDKDDVFVNVTPLSSKPPTIIDYKIYKEGKKEHFQIFRANGNHQMYLTFSTMLKNIDN